jgi:hypothetical protein
MQKFRVFFICVVLTDSGPHGQRDKTLAFSRNYSKPESLHAKPRSRKEKENGFITEVGAWAT